MLGYILFCQYMFEKFLIHVFVAVDKTAGVEISATMEIFEPLGPQLKKKKKTNARK